MKNFGKISIVGLIACAIAVGQPLAASANTINFGTKSCTGDSHIYTTAFSTGLTIHTIVGVPSSQGTYIREFDGGLQTSRRTNYYPGAQGTYTGHVYSQVGRVSSASLSCDV